MTECFGSGHFTLDEEWETQHCELVAFVQDNDTKEILQGTKILLSELTSNPTEEITEIPVKLLGNYPNPFNPTTRISFALQQDSNVKVNIYNAKGQKIKTLVNKQMQAGNHLVEWNGVDDNNKQVSSGIYFYRMEAGKYNHAKKMMLLK